MSSTSSTSKPVRRSSKDDNSSEDENSSLDSTDIISNLPDAIIQHILSFLPIEQAVETALISRRWRYLWTLVPSLEFCYDGDSGYFGENDGDGLTFFVNKVMIFNRTQSLNRFCLRCLASLDPINVEPWIVVATLRCVRELDLRVPGFALPSSVFVSKNLEVLKLEDCIARIPSSVNLPCLKILHLVNLVYPHRELADAFVSHVLSGCPVLEDLLFDGYAWEKGENDKNDEDNNMMLRICTPTLKSIELWANDGDIYSTIEINAPALKYLDAYYLVCDEFLVHDSPDIQEVHFRGFRSMGKDVETLLSCINKVEALHLLYDSWGDEFKSINVPKMENLKYLEVTCGFLESLPAICESAPNLETLIIDQEVEFMEELHWPQMPSVPVCLLRSLKTFGYFGFMGSRDELDFVEYIMKHGLALNLVTIKDCYQDSETDPSKWRVFKKLAEFPRSSRMCRLKFD